MQAAAFSNAFFQDSLESVELAKDSKAATDRIEALQPRRASHERPTPNKAVLMLQALLGLLQISIRRPRHLCFRYRFHQQRKCFVETCGAGSFTSIVPEAHHDEIMRRNYQSGLPAGA